MLGSNLLTPAFDTNRRAFSAKQGMARQFPLARTLIFWRIRQYRHALDPGERCHDLCILHQDSNEHS